MLQVYEILVPTKYGDTIKPISIKHHRNWDKFVRSLTGGLTIMQVARGQWVEPSRGELFEERVIPVRIACTAQNMEKIVNFSLVHYRQKCIMFYLISNHVQIKYANKT